MYLITSRAASELSVSVMRILLGCPFSLFSLFSSSESLMDCGSATGFGRIGIGTTNGIVGDDLL